MTGQPGPRSTPLHELHVAAGARMAEFAGWSLPLRFAGELLEHAAVREHAGMFDVSHMGRLEIVAADPLAALAPASPLRLDRLAEVGAATYGVLLDGHGGIVDDLVAMRTGSQTVLLVVNASRRAADCSHLLDHLGPDANAEEVTDLDAMIAVQGPAAMEVLDRLGVPVPGTTPFRCHRAPWRGDELLVSTTGYTGEHGVEVIGDPGHVSLLWNELLAAGVAPCGLVARDSLRLEACLALYGADIDEQVDPLAAGLGWTLDRTRDDWLGQAAIECIESAGGPARRLVPLRCEGRGIPRPGCAVLDGEGERVGAVTSGTMSPTLRTGIALAMVDAAHATVDTGLVVDVRGRQVPARVARRPLHR